MEVRKVLVEFGESRKVVVLNKETCIKKAIMEAFGLKENITFQVYSEEWKEFIDVDENEDQVADRAKLRVKHCSKNMATHDDIGNTSSTQKDPNPNVKASNQLTINFENGNLKLGGPIQVAADTKESELKNITTVYTEKELQEKSKIYGKDGRVCSRYEELVNKAAYDLCIDDGSLLDSRNMLFLKAKEKVNVDGYSYKKGQSRSKVFGNEKERPAKRIKLEYEIRKKKILEVSEDIKSCKDTISLLEQQRSKFITVQKYLQAAETVNQISEHRKKMRELETQLVQLQKKEGRSKKCQIKKKGKHQNTEKKLSSFFSSTKTINERNDCAMSDVSTPTGHADKEVKSSSIPLVDFSEPSATEQPTKAQNQSTPEDCHNFQDSPQ